MGEFAWNVKYSIGNGQIDAEHQRLIALANDIATLSGSGENLARIKEAIVALYDYVKTHFQHEEEYTCFSLATRTMRSTKSCMKGSSPR